MKYTIDARGKKLGRVASEAAMVLLGKNSASFAKNVVAPVKVEILNAKDTDITALSSEGASNASNAHEFAYSCTSTGICTTSI
jgi:ribosomal protein L13